MLPRALVLPAFLALAAPTARAQEVVVQDRVAGCYGESERVDRWTIRGDELACGERRLPRARLEALRGLALAAPEEVGDLLGTLGVTPEALAAHRDDVLAAALPPTWKEAGRPPELPAHLEPLLAWKRLREPMEREARSANWRSTTYHDVEVVLPGEPEVTLRSRGLVAWMLPWEITAGERTWTSPDVRLSRALLPLFADDSPSRALLDGESYWRDGLWRDRDFWRRWVGGELDAAFSENAYARLDGWELANALLRVDEVMTGHVNLKPLSMFFQLSARRPSAIDELRWYAPLEGDRPTHGWHDLLGTWREATAAVEREAWIGAWKRAGPARTVGLEVVGARGVGETMLEPLVMPAWRHAGFRGEPDFELLLRRDRTWCATIFLARGQAGGLIVRAEPVEGDPAHWLDALDVSFHPRSDVPAYARVDAAGKVQVRTLR